LRCSSTEISQLHSYCLKERRISSCVLVVPMDASTVETAQDNYDDYYDYERRVKPRLEYSSFCSASPSKSHAGESALVLPETFSTGHMRSPIKLETSPHSPVVEYACVQEQVASSNFSTSHHLHSDACVHAPPATVPVADGDAPSDSSSFCPSGASATPYSLNSFTAGSSSNCHDLVVHARPSPRPPSTVCTGGTGECTTPHLRVIARGMCNSCYQREYRHKTLANTPKQVKSVHKREDAPSPPIDRSILCDEHGVPILDEIGLPIKATPSPCPLSHHTFSPTPHPSPPTPQFNTSPL
jgi:hypothetical protein